MHPRRIVRANQLEEDITTARAYDCPHCDYVAPIGEINRISFVRQSPPGEFVVSMEFITAKAVLQDLRRLEQHDLNDETEKLLSWLQNKVGWALTEESRGKSNGDTDR